jgi:hypothetical protein
MDYCYFLILELNNLSIYTSSYSPAGRAAILYQEGFSRLTEQDFADLFSLYRNNGLDWLKCKQHISTVGSGHHYVIYPRNRHNSGIATALRCDKLITQLLRS